MEKRVMLAGFFGWENFKDQVIFDRYAALAFSARGLNRRARELRPFRGLGSAGVTWFASIRSQTFGDRGC
jgi:hypothetical protein